MTTDHYAAMPPAYEAVHYTYAFRTSNLTAEAVGVVKGEKHFPVFADHRIFKPLTKSKPYSTPLFAYAEVFWSAVIRTYFAPAPLYQLAFCDGYEKETGKYLDYGTAVPVVTGDGEYLLNLLEFFRKYPDEKVDIDQYVNYCQMFYDFTSIFEASYFQTHRDMAEQLALQVLVSVVKGDQNYHYENVAFLCKKAAKSEKSSGKEHIFEDEILGLAPMIDHEFSTYHMFPDHFAQHKYAYDELVRSVVGVEVSPEEYAFVENETERKLIEASAVALHRNLMYIREHYPEVTQKFVRQLTQLENDLHDHREWFELQRNPQYPDTANSFAFRIGMARYKEKNEEKAAMYEAKYAGKEKMIDFDVVNSQAIYEIKQVIRLMKQVLA